MNSLLRIYLLILISFTLNAQKTYFIVLVHEEASVVQIREGHVTLRSSTGKTVEKQLKSKSVGMAIFGYINDGQYDVKIDAPGYHNYEAAITVSKSLVSSGTLSVGMRRFNPRTRTVSIDYTKYDRLLAYARFDKNPAGQAKLLLEETHRVFKPEDEEFYGAYRMAGQLYAESNPVESMKCYEIAIQLRKEHYPFMIRGNFDVYPDKPDYVKVSSIFYSPIDDVIELAQVQNDHGLFSNAIATLELNKNKISDAKTGIKFRYLTMLANCYLLNGDARNATENFKSLENILNSGEALNINPTREEVWDAMNVSKRIRKIVKRNSTNLNLLAQNEQNSEDLLKFTFYQNYADALLSQGKIAEAVPYQQGYVTLSKSIYEGYRSDSVKYKGREYSYPWMAFDYRDFNGSWKLISSLYKLGKKEEAHKSISNSADRAVFFQLNDQFIENQKEFFALQDRVKAYTTFTPRLARISSEKLADFNLIMLCAGKSFDKPLTTLRERLLKQEEIVQKNFTILTENERKEFIQEYSKSLNLYYSIQLGLTGQDNSRNSEMLNKSIQTKGLILDISREQEIRIKRATDPVLLKQINDIKEYRDKIIAISGSTDDANKATEDSVTLFNARIDNLQRSLNEKIGGDYSIARSTWLDLQKKLKPDECFVDIIRVKRENFMYDAPTPQYWAFIVSAETSIPTLILLGEGNDFEYRDVRRYRNNLKAQLEDNSSYETYWKKVADATTNKKKIYLSSDGIYHLINPLNFKNPLTGKFVVDEIEIVRVPSGRSVLTQQPVSPVKINYLTLVGNPDFKMNRKTNKNVRELRPLDLSEIVSPTQTRSGFSELPGTKKEIDVIASLALDKAAIHRFEGTDASELKIKSIKTPTILHIATHGEFTQQNGTDSYLQSKLILAGAGDGQAFTLSDYSMYEDGFLTAYEVTEMDLLNTDLVILSACETGLGEIQNGEGVWGLQRAFQLAGAKNVLGSLWKISDEATVVFMESFYTALLNGSSTSQSYQTAMKETRKQFSHPYYWGAFTLTQ
jgi:CHAT domain-containing protein